MHCDISGLHFTPEAWYLDDGRAQVLLPSLVNRLANDHYVSAACQQRQQLVAAAITPHPGGA